MADVIVGGQILCLLITLLITPVAFTYFDSLTAWFFRVVQSGKRLPPEGVLRPEAVSDLRQ